MNNFNDAKRDANAGDYARRKEQDLMRIDELKESVDGIRMTDDMRRTVIENVKKRTEAPTGEQKDKSDNNRRKEDAKPGRKIQADGQIKASKNTRGERNRRYHTAGWQKNLAAAAIVIVVIGAAAVPVKALVNSVVKERMEEMPQEEKDAYVETLKEQEAEADGYSRAYTQSEEERYREMVRKYQEGSFPEKAVVQVDSEEEAAEYEFCLLKPAAMFCLPDRELTDEELLEIIDFIAKREYAQREDYAREHAGEIAEEEEQKKAEIAVNVEEGGITEQQAIEIATQKLSEIFGITEDGFERNSYYDEREDGRGAVYCVNWSNILSHQYYYFYIDAKDGHMTWADHSGEEVHAAPSVMVEEAQRRIPGLQDRAEECMKNVVGESYNEVYVYYLKYTDGSAGSTVAFYFAGEDQSAFRIAYTWDGFMYSIEETDISELEDGKERELWNGEEYIKTNIVFQEMDQ